MKSEVPCQVESNDAFPVVSAVSVNGQLRNYGVAEVKVPLSMGCVKYKAQHIVLALRIRSFPGISTGRSIGGPGISTVVVVGRARPAWISAERLRVRTGSPRGWMGVSAGRDAGPHTIVSG